MNPILTRAEVQAQIERFLDTSLSAPQLARWAFQRFCDIEEELLVAEAEHEDEIEAVLDQLMWGDSDPFVITEEAAATLLWRLTSAEAPDQGAN